MTKKIILPLVLLLIITGCKKNDSNTAPKIEGVSSIECIVYSSVDLLDGVLAYDKEDGDITKDMNITVSPSVNVSNGYAIFDKAGNYKVSYSICDSSGLKTEKKSDITVIDREVFYDFSNPNGFYIETAGNTILNSSGMKNNEYKILAQNCEVAEDLKLSRVFNLDSGYDYQIRYNFFSSASGIIKFLVDGNLADEQFISQGDNIITFNYNTKNKSTITLSLLLGELANDLEFKLNNVETERNQPTGEIELLNSFTVENRFDGTEGNAYKTDEKSAKLEVTKESNDDWRAGMFLNTGIEMNSGNTYKVSFDINRLELKKCDIVFQYKQWDAVGKEYGFINVNEDINQTSHSIEFTVSDDNFGSLWIYVQSGTNINEILLSNLSVKTTLTGTKKEYINVSDFTNSNDGFNCTFETFNGGFKYYIEEFGSIDYEQKVTSPSFYLDGSGKNYIITFKAKATAKTEVVFAAPIADGWDPTWVWHRFEITEEEKTFTFYGTDNNIEAYNCFVWQFGSTKNQKNKNVTINISDIKISLKNTEYDGE